MKHLFKHIKFFSSTATDLHNKSIKVSHRQTRKKAFLSAAVIALMQSALLLTGCGKEPDAVAPYIERTGFSFDTVINVRIYDKQDESLLDGCMKLADKYDKMFDINKEDSQLSRINSSAGKTVTVSEETADIISTALKYADLSGGAFNPSMGSVIGLWDFTSGSYNIPSQTAVDSALEHIDYRNITVDTYKNTVTVADPGCHIALGAIAKGYIADKMKDYLTSAGVNSAIINLGGNVLLIGSKPDGSDFTVGIEKPFEGTTSYAATVSLSDRSVVTSGVYERYFTVDDRIYHHILDPATGFPSDTGLYSVTILSDRSVDGDALSTSCFVLGRKKGMELIESLDNTEAVFITDKNEMIYSSGFPH